MHNKSPDAARRGHFRLLPARISEYAPHEDLRADKNQDETAHDIRLSGKPRAENPADEDARRRDGKRDRRDDERRRAGGGGPVIRNGKPDREGVYRSRDSLGEKLRRRERRRLPALRTSDSLKKHLTADEGEK